MYSQKRLFSRQVRLVDRATSNTSGYFPDSRDEGTHEHEHNLIASNAL